MRGVTYGAGIAISHAARSTRAHTPAPPLPALSQLAADSSRGRTEQARIVSLQQALRVYDDRQAGVI